MPALLCPKCGFNNPPGMHFCGNCGMRLPSATSSLLLTQPKTDSIPDQVGVMMGADLLERFRQAGLEAAGQKRNVTILFADIVGFTRMSQQVDDEDIYVLIQQFSGLLAKDVYRYDGMVDKFMGDGVMAIFGAPIAMEKSAEMALRAALDMQNDIIQFSAQVQERLGFGLSLHIGLHSGPVIVGSIGSNLMMNYTAIGDTVNLAARLQQNCPADAIIVSEATYQTTQATFDFKPLPPMILRGIAEPVTSYRVIGLKPEPGTVRGLEGMTSPLIGRVEELEKISRAAKILIKEGRGGMVIIEGEAGIGKSRLITEFRKSIQKQPAHLLVGYSYTYRRSILYWIFQDLLRSYFGIQPNTNDNQVRKLIRDKCAKILGPRAVDLSGYYEYLLQVGESSNRFQYLEAMQLHRQIFLAIRDLFEAEARLKPLVLIFEDLHWADETSLDLIQYLTNLAAQKAVLLVAVTRTVQEDWLARMTETARTRLGDAFIHIIPSNLTITQSNDLLANLLVSSDIPHNLLEQITQRAGGNPFYLEEIIRMLIEQKVITYESDHWCITPGTDPTLSGVPDTLQGLILARFDRLNQIQRQVLQVAAVIGRSFYSRLLKFILSSIDPGLIQSTLTELQQRNFIQPYPFFEDADYAFVHVLVSDAIYSTLLRADRSELHGQVGEAIEKLYHNRLGEMTELLARHYSWSTRLDRALHYLILAGLKETREYANQQARQHFDQALDIIKRIPHTLEQSLQARQGLGDVLLFTGDYRSAIQCYQFALDELAAFSSRGFASESGVLQRKISTAYERLGEYDQALAYLVTAQNTLETLPVANPVNQAWILNDIGWIFFRRGNLGDAEKYLLQALALVQNLENHDVIASIYNRLGGICYQKNQLDRAREYVRKSLSLRQKIGDLSGEARSSNNLGLLGWQSGEWNEALEAFSHSAELHARLGDIEGTIEIHGNLGLLYLDRGQFQEALQNLELALATAQKIGHSYHIGLGYFHLGRYYLYVEEWQKALENSQRCLAIFSEIGVEENRVNVTTYLGRAWLGLNEPARAKQYAVEALEIFDKLPESSQKSQVEERAHALRLLGRVELLQGNLEQASTVMEESAVIFKKADNLIELARANFFLAQIAAARQDDAGKQKLLAEALSIFERLGAQPDIEKLKILI